MTTPRILTGLASGPSLQADHLPWIVRLRFGAAVGQCIVILLATYALHINLPLAPLFAIVGLELLSNLLCVYWLQRRQPLSDRAVVGIMAFDILMLTGLLAMSGGAHNPFNFLYLVYIALAAVVLSPRWTWMLVGLSAACFGVLFWQPVALPGPDLHGGFMELHLRGMGVAFLVAAIFIVYFVRRVTTALAEREAALVRTHRLASLATLAAGAAHELATPLGSIAVVTKELERAYEHATANPRLKEDIGLVRSQVARCRDILQRMSLQAGVAPGEGLQRLPIADFIQEAILLPPQAERIAVEVAPELNEQDIQLPKQALAQALRAVVNNALDASQADQSVHVRAKRTADQLHLEVQDTGPGIPPDTLAHLGEPFFTTKGPGDGMGLGLFLTRSVLEQLGGTLTVASTVGQGTTVTLALPKDFLPS